LKTHAKKILVFAPNSIHVKKYIDMIKDDTDVHLVTNNPTYDYGVEMTLLKRDFLMPFRMKKILRATRPDYIHIHTINRVTPAVFIAKRLAGMTDITTIISAWGSSVLFEPWRSWFNKKIVQFCLNQCDIVTVDASIERYIVNLLTKERKTIRDINFGASRSTRFVGIDDKEKSIYSPRGHDHIYNIDKIIESFAAFHKSYPDWRLYISGYEHESNTPRYKKRAERLGLSDRIIFTGYISQSENAELMAKSKIVASVPFSDGKPHSIMEAINSGCVCFVSDLPSNHELITHGVNGFIVDDEELIDFAQHETINSTLMQQVNGMLTKSFSIENSKKNFLSLYDDGNVS